jgi:hypothetical protein
VSFWTILFLALLVVAVVLFMQLQKKSKADEAGGDSDGDSYSAGEAEMRGVGEARVGDTLSLPGRGDDFSDLDFRIDRRDRYESGGDEWFEVSGKYRGRRVYLELAEDDELECWLDSGKQELRLRDLGLEEEDLARIDEQKDYGAGFEWNGERWTYKESCEVGYFEDGRGQGEGFYSWSFENEDRNRVVWIEKYVDDPFEVGVAERVPPSQIQMFRA